MIEKLTVQMVGAYLIALGKGVQEGKILPANTAKQADLNTASHKKAIEAEGFSEEDAQTIFENVDVVLSMTLEVEGVETVPSNKAFDEFLDTLLPDEAPAHG